MYEKKYLNDILRKGENYLDLFRLLAASLVIIGHSYSISPQPPYSDGIASLLKFDYSGSLSVKFFFFLSGMLVTNSIMAKPDGFSFLLKRAVRIYPGLFVCVLVAVFVVGPVFTTLPLHQYFRTRETWTYLSSNFFIFHLQWRLPGVFASHADGLNGSLWTLSYEMTFYIYLAIFHGLGLLRNKRVANVFYIAMMILPYAAPQVLPLFLMNIDHARAFTTYFAFGCFCATNKQLIDIQLPKAILLWCLAYILNDSNGYPFFFYFALFYTIFYLASLPAVRRLRLPFDASYGVYIYGFIVQHCLVAVWPHLGVHGNQWLGIAIALSLGILSWYFVEKPFIELGNRLATRPFLSWFKNPRRADNSADSVRAKL